MAEFQKVLGQNLSLQKLFGDYIGSRDLQKILKANFFFFSLKALGL